jgi:uncharacterized integral membrane protein
MKYLIFALVVVLVLLLSTFGVQNPTPINVRFLQVQTGLVPLSVIVLVATLSGMLLIALAELPHRVTRRQETRRLRHQLVAAETRVTVLQERLPRPVMQPLPDERRSHTT